MRQLKHVILLPVFVTVNDCITTLQRARYNATDGCVVLSAGDYIFPDERHVSRLRHPVPDADRDAEHTWRLQRSQLQLHLSSERALSLLGDGRCPR